MKDFTKWAAMWDAYNRMGEAVSGSPASICQGIGVTLMMVFDFVGLIAVAVIGGGGGDPEKKPVLPLDHGDSRHRRCAGARIVRHAIPQRRPCIRTTHIDRANRENVGAGRNGRLQKHEPRAYRQPKPTQVEP